MKKQESLKKMNDEVAKMKLNEYQEEIKLNKEETISDKKVKS